MQPEIEKELKMLVSEEQFKRLTDLYQPLEFIPQINTYYASDASARHYFFRVREKQGRKLFTLKEHKDGVLYEHEKYFEGNLEDDPEIVARLQQFGVSLEDCYPLGQLVTERAMVISREAELCFDINHYNGIIDFEIEYEVKAEHDEEKAFRKILKAAGIRYKANPLSKYKRFVQSLNSSR
ncbi:MAG: CYTH domain-containing protein [Erysipelotrichaceae bacterium]|nr:CYTH domain-containing protein [Erysipelotrichaceae bacterium]